LLVPLRGLGFGLLDGGEHRNLVDHAAVLTMLTMLATMTTLLRVLQLVVVRTVHVKTMS
jgi:hypothetical protein